MIEPLHIAAIAGVIVLWMSVGFAIRRWGPGRVKRAVHCPEKNVGAKLEVLYREPEFGCVQAADVTACSLLGAAPVTCDKECLARL